MARRVYLYGFNDVLECVDHNFLQDNAISMRNIRLTAEWMKVKNPECSVVWAVDGRPGLGKEFMEAVKTKDFRKHVEFADTVSREGILIECK